MKSCPNCKKKYPDTDVFCNIDGSRLISVPTEPEFANPNKRNKLIYTLIAMLFVILLAVNMIPFGLKWAASNCSVDLVGISIKGKGSENIYEDIQDIFQEMKDVFSSGNIPEYNKEDITLILRIRNSNIFSFSINYANVRLYINNKQAADSELSKDQKVKIDSRSEKEIRLPLDVSFRVIPTILMDNEIRCRAEGKVLIETFIGEIEYPVNIDGVHLPVKVSEVRWNRFQQS